MTALIVALILLAGGRLAQAQTPELGETTFLNSGAAEAQEPFLRGLLLLHSFGYEDAREAFQEARGLGVTSGVASPTFVICREYLGRLRLYHLDAYRLEDPAELLLHGWDEMPETGVVAVEWGERIEELLPAERLIIQLDHAGGDGRRPSGPWT